MKSNWRTVLAATLSAVTSYSSGPLDVGDLGELLVSVHTTSTPSSTYFSVKSIDANGNWTQIATVSAVVEDEATRVSIGSAFGDQIQLDLVISGTISAQVSIKGR